MSNFRPVDRDTGFLLPPSVDEWLPEKHLARFVVEVIDGLDLGRMAQAYRGSGSASYHPSMLLGILVYGYATGVFSSRKLERATYDSVAFRFIAANQHPDHDTIAAFRRRFLGEITELFVQVLELAREMGLLQMGTVALDGTKIHANASRHSALSYEHAGKIEAQLKAEVADLLAKAEAADRADLPDGLSIPDELARREERLKKLAEARAMIEARARERFEREQAEYQAKLAARDAKAAATGRKPARGGPHRRLRHLRDLRARRAPGPQFSDRRADHDRRVQGLPGSPPARPSRTPSTAEPVGNGSPETAAPLRPRVDPGGLRRRPPLLKNKVGGHRSNPVLRRVSWRRPVCAVGGNSERTLMDREQARAEYRKILAGVVRHHQAIDRHVTGAAMARIAKRFDLRVKGGIIEAGDDEMTLVSDLAVYGRVAGSTRAIDRYARAVAGSLDTFDTDLLEALRRSWFSVFRFTSRHPIAGWYVDDRLLDRTGLWPMN